jgi:hypothetical protein
VFTSPGTIQVTVSDYVPARGVTLVGPEGELTAVAIDTAFAPPAYAPPPTGSFGFGLGGGGGHSFGGLGVGFGFPLGTPAPVPPPLVVSTATLRVPAEPGYASVWRDSQIRVLLGDTPNVKYITIPAPAPPG